MSAWMKKSLVAGMLAALIAGAGQPVLADDLQDQLPDMGTTAGSTLSIDQEMQMGDFYVRQMRGGAPLINDPLLNTYINHLGGILVAHANSVRTPFHFFLIHSDELNAFAFFGGNVVLHSALFHYTENESELASVLAHELSHVTQRHLARAMEDQKRNAPLTWAGVLGSILLTMANPQMGMAGLSGTIAGSQQGMISFTQANEQEADRIGLQVLQRSGFDPQAMPDFLQRLSDRVRYTTTPPEMLLTHPLPMSRLSDARNRANQMKHLVLDSSQDFYLAKARILGMYGSGAIVLDDDLIAGWKKGNARQQIAAQYGQAILFYQAKKYDDARRTLQPLLGKQPANVWFVDLMTDIDLAQQQAPRAITRLEALVGPQDNNANPVLLLNLANAYVEGKRFADAGRLLNRYTFNHPDDTNGWDLLAQASAGQGLRDQELAARAESLALNGELDQAVRALSNASSLVKLGSLQQARYDARIDQLRQLQKRFKPYQKT
ncbi:beta-barrel assembly-enhancing protease [Acerihabitans arboris]|uniref:Beta-barrel assembly-enhancing protease n=1 Tax=Acerihabitans arboris TaxID=2691583 RepID=A0A845SR46_9GAMM|nr:M48 family metallopeptidase [Acerihabitans arboris]NDL65404.1 M48 family metalloprotease [Acerihabitans arboris]